MIDLRTSFNRVADHLEEISRRLTEDPAVAGNLPVLDVRHWNRRREDFNCLSFAIDLPPHIDSYTWLRPGDIYYATQDGQVGVEGNWEEYDILKNHTSFEVFADYLMDNVIKDGLLPMGNEINITRGGFPAALFLRSTPPDPEMHKYDFHWYALRRKNVVNDNAVAPAVWAHKPGERFAVQCGNDVASAFKDAQTYGYHHFAGFYEVNPGALKTEALSGLLRPPRR